MYKIKIRTNLFNPWHLWQIIKVRMEKQNHKS
jgi:hypothetical protein